MFVAAWNKPVMGRQDVSCEWTHDVNETLGQFLWGTVATNKTSGYFHRQPCLLGRAADVYLESSRYFFMAKKTQNKTYLCQDVRPVCLLTLTRWVLYLNLTAAAAAALWHHHIENLKKRKAAARLWFAETWPTFIVGIVLLWRVFNSSSRHPNATLRDAP